MTDGTPRILIDEAWNFHAPSQLLTARQYRAFRRQRRQRIRTMRTLQRQLRLGQAVIFDRIFSTGGRRP